MDGCGVYLLILYDLFLFGFYFIIFTFVLFVLAALCLWRVKRIDITFVF